MDTSYRSRSYSPRRRRARRSRSDHYIDVEATSSRSPSPLPRRSRSRSRSAHEKSNRDPQAFLGAPGNTNRNRRNRVYPPPNGHDSAPSPLTPRHRKREITLLLCVYHPSTLKWRTAPITFRPSRTSDRALWTLIARTFNTHLDPWPRRLLGFKRVQNIVPIAFSTTGVPLRTNPRDFPGSRQLVHAYRYPELKSDRVGDGENGRWVEYFVSFDAGDARTNGLEFVEGLWAEKLGLLASAFSVAILVVSVVWCVKGGDLQTVFTVMGFVLAFGAAQVALVALYFQVVQAEGPGG